MTTYATVLGRLPPGTPRDAAWSGRVRRLPCPGLFFGDYDLHFLDRLDGPHALESIAERASIAPDHRMLLLRTTTAGSADPLTAWRAHAERWPLFCYVELKLQPLLLRQQSGTCLLAFEALILERLRERGIEPISFLSLSNPDLVLYLFGDDLSLFGEITLELRRLKLSELLERLGWRENDVRTLLHLRPDQATNTGHHLCQNTYSLYGVLEGGDGFANAWKRVRDEPTRARPVLFVGTFPGHERERSLIDAIAKVFPGTHADESIVNGVFDLLLSLRIEGEGVTQREILRRTTSLLSVLWTEFGPQSSNPTVLRTNTVWFGLGGGEITDDSPHAPLPAEKSAQVPLPRSALRNAMVPIVTVLQRIVSSYNVLALNRLTSAAVRELGPFIHAVCGIARHHDETGDETRDGQSAADEYFRSAFDDLAQKLESSLASRVHCAAHTFREEISIRPGSSFHKLLAAYSAICTQVVVDIAQVVDPEPLPEFIFTIGGLHEARSHWYFRAPTGTPQLAVLEVSGASLLYPARVVFPLTHELMHVVPKSSLKEELTAPLLSEIAQRICRRAIPTWPRDPDGLFPTVLDRLRSTIEVAPRSLTSYLRVREIARWCWTRSSYLHWVISGAEAAQSADLFKLETIRLALEKDLFSLLALAREALADVMAAFATEPRAYLRLLETFGSYESERVFLLRSVIDLVDSVTPSLLGRRPLIGGLLTVAKRIRLAERNVPPKFFSSLAETVWSMGEEQVPSLLAYYRGES